MSNSDQQQAYGNELQTSAERKITDFKNMTLDGAKDIIRKDVVDNHKDFNKEIKNLDNASILDKAQNIAYENELAEDANTTFSQRQGFSFAGDEFKKAKNGEERATLYRRDILNAAKKSIEIADTNHNGELDEGEFIAEDKEHFYETEFKYIGNGDNISYEEFEANYKKSHPGADTVPEELKKQFEALDKDKKGVDLKTLEANPQLFNISFDEKAAERKFNIISQGKKTIDPTRMATLYYLMDIDANDKVDGEVHPTDYCGLNVNLEDPTKETELKKIFEKAHYRLFEE